MTTTKACKICFWNLRSNVDADTLVMLANENQFNILLLAEVNSTQLNKYDTELSSNCNYNRITTSEHEKIHLYTNIENNFIVRRLANSATGRIAAWSLWHGSKQQLLLFAIHFYSKLYKDSIEQAIIASRISDEIETVERRVGYDSTIVIGDFNMNPFEAGIVAANSLNAVMSKSIARKGARTASGKKRKYFYNPSWGFYSELQSKTRGTYYFSGSEVEYYWHNFDQALLRPSIMDRVIDFSIVDTIGNNSLLSLNGRPNKHVFSDHLPIQLTLKEV